VKIILVNLFSGIKSKVVFLKYIHIAWDLSTYTTALEQKPIDQLYALHGLKRENYLLFKFLKTQ